MLRFGHLVMDLKEYRENGYVLSDSQHAYLDWLCTMPSQRVPNSKAKYALEFGHDETTLRRWQKLPAFRAEWKRRVEELQGSPERTQKLLDSLYEKGVAGDTKSAALWLQATNRLQPMPVQISGSKAAAELSDSELDSLVAALAEREQSKRSLKKTFNGTVSLIK